MLFTLFVYSTIKVMFLFSGLKSIDFHVDSQGMNSTSPFVTLIKNICIISCFDCAFSARV